MRKNISGQKIGCQMVSASDGSAFTGSVTVAVTGDAGTQATGSVGSGACTHEGNGYHTYAPAQAETNYDLVAFTFTGTGAIPATVQIYTRPTTGLLAPTTVDRTLDVTAGGCAGIDWANVEAPTTTLGLSGTTVKEATDVQTTLTAMKGATFDTSTDSLESLRNRGDAAWITATGFSTHSAADVWAVATRVLTAATNITAAIADAVWTEAIADHSGVSGSTAESLNAAGGAGDPWTTTLPGSYTGSQAGKILSDILTDTAVIGATGGGLTSLASAANLATVAGYIDTEIATIISTLSTIAGYIDTEVSTLVSELAKVPKSDSNVTWNATAAAQIQSEANDALVAYDASTGTDISTLTTYVGTQTSVISGLIGTPNDSVIQDLEARTLVAANYATAAELLKVPKSDSNVTWNATAAAQIQSEANNALVANHLDHLLAADYDPASKPGVSTALLNELVENDGGVSRYTANALEQAPSGGGGGATANEIADAVWDEATSGHATAGTTGKALIDAQSAGDPWATAVPGAYAAGTAGNIIGNLDYDDLADAVAALAAMGGRVGSVTVSSSSQRLVYRSPSQVRSFNMNPLLSHHNKTGDDVTTATLLLKVAIGDSDADAVYAEDSDGSYVTWDAETGYMYATFDTAHFGDGLLESDTQYYFCPGLMFDDEIVYSEPQAVSPSRVLVIPDRIHDE